MLDQGIKEGIFFDKVYSQQNIGIPSIQPVLPDPYGDWIDFALRLFGDLRGKHILELGCGAGYTTAKLALSGANVFAIDASQAGIDATITLAAKMNCSERIIAKKMLAEEIDFKKGTFDGIFGSLILHHIPDLISLSNKCHSVMKPNGQAIFCENSDRNPFARMARKYLLLFPGFKRQGTQNERQLSARDVQMFGESWAITHQYFPQFVFFQELSRVGPFKSDTFNTIFKMMDSITWRIAPPLRCYSVLQVLEFID